MKKGSGKENYHKILTHFNSTLYWNSLLYQNLIEKTFMVRYDSTKIENNSIKISAYIDFVEATFESTSALKFHQWRTVTSSLNKLLLRSPFQWMFFYLRSQLGILSMKNPATWKCFYWILKYPLDQKPHKIAATAIP